MKINDVTELDSADSIGVITINAPPVNALSAEVRRGIATAMERAIGDPSIQAIVLMCAGRTFFAGADITEFGKPPISPTIWDGENVIENAPKPVIAALHGTALGGGLEVALVAHYRIAVFSAKCGLPEVNLGILPGAGGTQRLPRIVGVQKALEMITSGQPVSASTAHAVGLVDALAGEGSLRADAITFAKMVVGEKRPLRKVRDVDEKLAEARGKPEIFAAFRKENAKKFRGFLAPEAIIRCIEAAVTMPFEDGLAFERSQFLELVAGPQSAAQRHIFFAEHQVAKVDDIPGDTPALPITRVGIIGAGTMGGGIAMNFLNAGLPVTMVEVKQDALDRGLGIIRKNYEGAVKKGRLSIDEMEKRLARLTGSLEFERLAECDLIIEAVFELMEIKQDVFGRLDKIARADTILATNTSYLDIDKIAAATSRPENVLGLHFFSPANIMRLLEIVRGARTSKQVLATAMKMAKTIGKVGVVAGNCHGFIGNRMLAKRQGEADKLMLEGALPWDIDRVLVEFGFPMGPFAMRDLAGVDIGWDPAKTSSSTVREILNEMGRRGQKTGAGYYDYDDNRNPTPSTAVEKVISDFAAKQGMAGRKIDDQEIVERCLYIMVNEGAKILDEGIANRASDIDVVWNTGYGWPAYRGGPMFWADTVGLSHIVARLTVLAERYGEDFRPAPLLQHLAKEGKAFSRS